MKGLLLRLLGYRPDWGTDFGTFEETPWSYLWWSLVHANPIIRRWRFWRHPSPRYPRPTWRQVVRGRRQ